MGLTARRGRGSNALSVMFSVAPMFLSIPLSLICIEEITFGSSHDRRLGDAAKQRSGYGLWNN
ncbi:hypothetical protein ABRZ24_04090 [Brenneria populi]|uniref:Uncharacterized protein n=1 Tax=Brenneria populi TaxID=1505588 RepID=A0ABU6JN70_9GAMM|nr:hypothetical protein [Brenneria populi Li et al. 2015]